MIVVSDKRPGCEFEEHPVPSTVKGERVDSVRRQEAVDGIWIREPEGEHIPERVRARRESTNLGWGKPHDTGDLRRIERLRSRYRDSSNSKSSAREVNRVAHSHAESAGQPPLKHYAS